MGNARGFQGFIGNEGKARPIGVSNVDTELMQEQLNDIREEIREYIIKTLGVSLSLPIEDIDSLLDDILGGSDH